MHNRIALYGGEKTIDKAGRHFVWPRITDRVREVVMNQLDTSISTYDNSGVIKDFEDQFCAYHGRTKVISFNSGTSAIYAMYKGIQIEVGDEIICPTYTFFATISPMINLGGVPVFCDSDDSGNIDPSKIEALITNKTKALIVTHMWGIPCDMDPIVEICKKHSIRLLEDCSHAHGARYKGKLVGTFGDAAAWSVQGEKIISGGEGGMFLTDDVKIFENALLTGHYNKRAMQQIAVDSDLRDFAPTGYGLKLRAHPLAMSIAKEQFSHLDEWHYIKHNNALKIIKSLKCIPWLRFPQIDNCEPSWYGLIMQFDASNSFVGFEEFYSALQAEGLTEIDHPSSTMPNHTQRLFNIGKGVEEKYPKAKAFYEGAIKIPVWAYEDEEWIVDKYIEGFLKVARYFQSR